MEESYQLEGHSPKNQLCWGAKLTFRVTYPRFSKVLSSDEGLTFEMGFNCKYICTDFFINFSSVYKSSVKTRLDPGDRKARFISPLPPPQPAVLNVGVIRAKNAGHNARNGWNETHAICFSAKYYTSYK